MDMYDYHTFYGSGFMIHLYKCVWPISVKQLFLLHFHRNWVTETMI